ncbi:MAG: methionyl-tRNA formyltransferase [Spirochaetaceae bacterium]|jgi:methionyl-tRNA formyltransferase|nr:methionyl-tRNA formyltransferase [Spirochaetaceae bacterium]
MPMSLVFAGSPAIAVPALRAIVGAGHRVAAVLTNPDTAKGRSPDPVPTPVALCAEELRLPVLKNARIDGGVMDAVRGLSPSLLVTFAYGALFPAAFLNLFQRGGINCHPSLLPKYRGAAPIQEAILKRDAITGITIQYLAEKMDAGDIILTEEMPLHGRETTEDLSALAAERGAALLVRAVSLIETNAVKRVRQEERDASYCGKTGKDEGRIDWSRAADDIDAQIRAFTPWPLCRTHATGKELLVLEARGAGTGGKNGMTARDAPGTVIGVDRHEGILVQTGQGVLAITRLQWKSKKALDFRDFLNGTRHFVGTMLE